VQAIEEVLKEYPNLTGFGFGGDGKIDPNQVQACIEWLLAHDALDRRKTINTRCSSYGWKHVVEKDKSTYISNGAFICAALYLKYRMKRAGPTNPNAYFNIRKVRG